MQFVIIASDGKDSEAPLRRQKARPDHIQNTNDNMKHMIMGVATLDDQGGMNGSVMVVDFPSREDLDAWLGSEPYAVQGVWKEITVVPCRVGPSFIKTA
jgi:uncharacterized protein YciI